MKAPPQPSPRRTSAATSPATWALFLIAVVYYAFNWSSRGLSLDLDQVLLSVPSAGHARNWSVFYTAGPHFVGQGLHQAQWTQARWEEFGLADSRIVSYEAQLPIPTDQHRLALLRGPQVLHEARLVDNDHRSSDGQGFMPAYYGFSANGNITASYVFANLGADEDYEALVQANISLAGKIAVVKSADVSPYLHLHRLEMQRGKQIGFAGKRGLAGVVIYPDPQNDEPVSEGNGYKPFPEGPARPSTAIERGTLVNIGECNHTRVMLGLSSLLHCCLLTASRWLPRELDSQNPLHPHLLCRCHPHPDRAEWPWPSGV